MEITRNSRTAKVSLPNALAPEIISIRFENVRDSVLYIFGEDAPTETHVMDGSVYVNSDTGMSYIADSEGQPVSNGNKFNPLTVSVSIPYDFVTYCGKFDIKWTYLVNGREYTEVQQHTVIQPLFTAQELRDFDPDFKNANDGAILRLERVVRAVIERITGQKFELTYGVESARSHNGGTLVMPKRAVVLDGYSGYVAGVKASVESDGWIVRAFAPFEYTTKMYANPIHDTYLKSAFREGIYRLRGEWGYRSVPEQIVLAALLLAQEYGCRESSWRDKYVETIKNVDWGVTFDSRAFAGTGNVKVDQILQSYTLNKMVVI